MEGSEAGKLLDASEAHGQHHQRVTDEGQALLAVATKITIRAIGE
jgi:hypothetical protein